MLGLLSERWGSLARMGRPESVTLPLATHQLLPRPLCRRSSASRSRGTWTAFARYRAPSAAVRGERRRPLASGLIARLSPRLSPVVGPPDPPGGWEAGSEWEGSKGAAR